MNDPRINLVSASWQTHTSALSQRYWGWFPQSQVFWFCARDMFSGELIICY